MLFIFLALLLSITLASPTQGAAFQISVTSLSSPTSFGSPNSVPLGSFVTDAPIAVATFKGITYLAFKQAAGSNIFLQSTQNILESSSWSAPVYISGSLTGFAPALFGFQNALWMSWTDSTGQVYVTSSSTPKESGSWSPPFSLTGNTKGALFFYNAPNFNIQNDLLCVLGSLKKVSGTLGWVCLNQNQTHWSSAVYQGVTSSSSNNQWFFAQFQGLTYSTFLGSGGSNIDYLISDSIGAVLFPDSTQWRTISTTSEPGIPVIVWQKLLFVAFRGSSSSKCYFTQSLDGLAWSPLVALPAGQECSTTPALLVQNNTLYYFSLS